MVQKKKLNNDILYLIFRELRFDSSILYSSLLVNKTWCQIIIPILWENPWKYVMSGRVKKLINTIISHLFNKSRYLYSTTFQTIIHNLIKKPEKHKISIFQNELLKLYINENTKFTHLYVFNQFDFRIYDIPGAKQCFTELRFLYCSIFMNNNVLTELLGICKSVSELEFMVDDAYDINYDVIRLIDISEKLTKVKLRNNYNRDNSAETLFYKNLETSLIKHANTMRYFNITRQPITNILSSFVNLKELELDRGRYCTWNCLENLSLPFLQILKAKSIPGKKLASLIENTGGYLTEISIEFKLWEEISNKKIIQAIYKKCPKLKYLKSVLLSKNITEFEKILINCQYLDELFISVDDFLFDPDNLFEILTKSSPTSLFKFRIWNLSKPESLKSFFDNWKGRHPMTLELDFKNDNDFTFDSLDLIKKYKGERVISKFILQ